MTKRCGATWPAAGHKQPLGGLIEYEKIEDCYTEFRRRLKAAGKKVTGLMPGTNAGWRTSRDDAARRSLDMNSGRELDHQRGRASHVGMPANHRAVV
jgi:hypothetical protein